MARQPRVYGAVWGWYFKTTKATMAELCETMARLLLEHQYGREPRAFTNYEVVEFLKEIEACWPDPSAEKSAPSEEQGQVHAFLRCPDCSEFAVWESPSWICPACKGKIDEKEPSA